MQKDVIIFLDSIQRDLVDEDSRIEAITAGTYYYKNNKHYIIYEEIPEEGGPAVKNLIKVSKQRTEIIKSGDVTSRLIFEENKKNLSYYDMPYGKMLLGLETDRITIEEEADRLLVRLEYRLEMDYQQMADCVVDIRVESKDTCKVDLRR